MSSGRVDKVRNDWAALASLAEVHEQDRPPSRRPKTRAADRLWAEIERLRAVADAAREVYDEGLDGVVSGHSRLRAALDDLDTP